ncbi:MAG: SPOR domain-containing protein [Rhodoferax sp.]|nr:SPOR domain-containing protein [Rhodoferax sp.]
MAFFKFRKKGDTTDGGGAVGLPVQSVQELRRRAKYRLVGAAVLVLVGVIGLPLLLDRHPRPIPVNTPIEIPDRDKVLPLLLSAPAASRVAHVTSAVTPLPSEPVVAKASTGSIGPAATAGKTTPPTTLSAPAPIATASAAPATAKPDSASRAQLILEGQSAVPLQAVAPTTPAKSGPVAATDGPRFVVQVGAFADNARAREVRLKLEKTGLKTYAQVAETKDGRRVRVRVGPFATKADAERAASKIKKLDLPAALLTL